MLASRGAWWENNHSPVISASSDGVAGAALRLGEYLRWCALMPMVVIHFLCRQCKESWFLCQTYRIPALNLSDDVATWRRRHKDYSDWVVGISYPALILSTCCRQFRYTLLEISLVVNLTCSDCKKAKAWSA